MDVAGVGLGDKPAEGADERHDGSAALNADPADLISVELGGNAETSNLVCALLRDYASSRVSCREGRFDLEHGGEPRLR